MENADRAIGKRFQGVREASGLTRAEFAAPLCLSEAVIAAWEAGEMVISTPTLILLERRYAVDLHELLTGEPSPTIGAEVEALRKLKHEVRVMRNEASRRLKVVAKTDRLLAEAAGVLEDAIKPYKRAAGKTKDDTSRGSAGQGKARQGKARQGPGDVMSPGIFGKDST